MPRILLADDDRTFCQLLADYLRTQGFEISAVHDGVAAIETIDRNPPDALVLDVMMPKADGFKVLEQVRAKHRVPVLMLTARGEDIDRIVGLEMGADDYLAKPCNPRELAARLRAVLRRSHRTHESGAPLTAGDVRLSQSSRACEVRGRPVELTGAEFEVLRVLIEAAGTVVAKEEVARRALKRRLGTFDRSIDMHVSRLRSKLGDLNKGAPCIKTIRNRGYLLVVGQ
jgi:two-component system response regulator CpxR